MATLPGHKWELMGSDKKKSAFVYKCKKCNHTTLSGVALKSPYDKACQ